MEVNEPTVAYGKQKVSIEAYLEMENAAIENMNIIKVKCLPCQVPRCRMIQLQVIYSLLLDKS